MELLLLKIRQTVVPVAFVKMSVTAFQHMETSISAGIVNGQLTELRVIVFSV